MEITVHHIEGEAELRLRGRLDAHWATHLTRELETLVRENRHVIVLDFREVDFLSSAGISVLLRYYKMLLGMQGALRVVNPSDNVRKVLDLSGVTQFLLAGKEAPVAKQAKEEAATRLESAAASYLVYPLSGDTGLSCRPIGRPELLADAAYTRDDCTSVPYPSTTFGFGIGAIGENFDDCAGRFGEYLAMGGAVFHLPGNGANLPDYDIARRSFVPSVHVLSGVLLQGAFTHHARFETENHSEALTASELFLRLHETAGGGTVGFVVLAETSGLVGTWLRRSPVQPGSAVFSHPEVREWFGYSLEPLHARSLAWVVGIVARGEDAALRPFLRPLATGSDIVVHAHAAALSYRHVTKGKLDLHQTVATMFDPDTFDSESSLGLLHLINDDRPFTGRGQSEFLRGACWFGPVTSVKG